jgi:hypothetical protein
MAGCAVGLFDLGEHFDTRELLAKPQTTTDAEGRYDLACRQQHYYVVVVAVKAHQVCVQRLPSEPGAVRYLPDALMLPGTVLRGRVRDDAGNPVAGALVRVEDPLLVNQAVMAWFESQGYSDEHGILEVPGVPRTGLRVTVSAPGFPAVSQFAAHDSPLNVTLRATGLVRGRVVDVDGTPVAEAVVRTVTVEPQDPGTQVRTDAAGRFRIAAPLAARFRLSAFEGKPPYREFSSGLLRGPVDDVVLTSRSKALVRRVTLRCVDAATKAPLEEFQASWRSIDSKMSTLMLMEHPVVRAHYRGEAVIEVTPDARKTTLGTIIADAPGHGFAIVPVADDPKEPLVAELPVECFIAGTLIDAETGKPAAGAAVRALPRIGVQGGGPDPWKVGAISGADGSFRLGGLSPGSYDVQVYGQDRPASRSTNVTVGTGEPTPVRLEVPKRRFLEFEVSGDVPPGCLATITWIGGSIPDGGNMLQANLPQPPIVPVAGPRAHKLGPVGNGQFRAQLQVPTRDRVGSAVTIELGDVDQHATLQLPDLRQFMHTGRAHLPPDVPAERVAVLALRTDPVDPQNPFAWMTRRPFANCLAADGSFVLDLPAGRYTLQLADLETGLVFHTEREERDLGADTVTTPLELRPVIRWLEIALEPTQPGGEAVCHYLTIDAERPRAELPALLRSNSASNTRQQGYWSWRPGTTQTRWLIGEGSLKLTACQAFQVLAPGGNGPGKDVDSIEVSGDQPRQRVTLRLPPPPDDAKIIAGDK